MANVDYGDRNKGDTHVHKTSEPGFIQKAKNNNRLFSGIPWPVTKELIKQEMDKEEPVLDVAPLGYWRRTAKTPFDTSKEGDLLLILYKGDTADDVRDMNQGGFEFALQHKFIKDGFWEFVPGVSFEDETIVAGDIVEVIVGTLTGKQYTVKAVSGGVVWEQGAITGYLLAHVKKVKGVKSGNYTDFKTNEPASNTTACVSCGSFVGKFAVIDEWNQCPRCDSNEGRKTKVIYNAIINSNKLSQANNIHYSTLKNTIK